MKINLNCSLEPDVYQAVKRTVPHGQVSPLVNNLLKEYLKKQKEQALKKAYQDFAKNKQLKKELATLEKASVKDIAKKLVKNE